MKMKNPNVINASVITTDIAVPTSKYFGTIINARIRFITAAKNKIIENGLCLFNGIIV